ncbi:hypothetical protein JG687_00001758 [Phytophthora cactorum]|uniref:Ubiquitin-like protease family profile domain-containing protein n=1 Tax=Phytophthora cactorum TaxID=29920 RepID=A0A8T1UX80_9STRA|nr:hypothetical protein JG687_00001758 [Phytophthora cactorum]
MPMNINGSHWTCLLVDRTTRSIYCYHSPSALPQLTGVHCPIQKDGDNCGLFICLFYWRRVFKEAGKDYSESGLLRRR